MLSVRSKLSVINRDSVIRLCFDSVSSFISRSSGNLSEIVFTENRVMRSAANRDIGRSWQRLRS